MRELLKKLFSRGTVDDASSLVAHKYGLVSQNIPSRVVAYVLDACLPCAVGAAVETVFGLDAVADDLAAAMITNGRKLVDCTLEAVERVTRSGSHHFE